MCCFIYNNSSVNEHKIINKALFQDIRNRIFKKTDKNP